MVEKILQRLTNDLVARLVLTGLIVVLPVGITTSWLSGVFRQMLWQEDFLKVFLGLLFWGGIPVFLTGLIVLYAIERWIIAGRALHSWKWSVARILLYMAAGIPEGWACLGSFRLVFGRFPAGLENFYFVQTVVISVVMGILYTMIERSVEEIRRREAGFKLQIETLRVEIDELRRQQQVKEIIETDFFQDLRQKAQQFRRRSDDAVPS